MGLLSFDHTLPAGASARELAALIDRLNADPQVDAILLQMPLPGGLDPLPFVERIDPAKDADGLHPVNLGRLVLGRPGLRPATPAGILRLLDHYGVSDPREFRGGGGAVLPGGAAAGDPLGLKGRDATVTLAHTRDPRPGGPDPAGRHRGGRGRAAGAHRAASTIRPGATVVDVGVNRTDRGWWATWTSPPSRRWPGPSPRCPAGWGR